MFEPIKEYDITMFKKFETGGVILFKEKQEEEKGKAIFQISE